MAFYRKSQLHFFLLAVVKAGAGQTLQWLSVLLIETVKLFFYPFNWVRCGLQLDDELVGVRENVFWILGTTSVQRWFEFVLGTLCLVPGDPGERLLLPMMVGLFVLSFYRHILCEEGNALLCLLLPVLVLWNTQLTGLPTLKMEH